MILVDSNVLLDLLTADPAWCGWSKRQLEAARLRGTIGIDEVVYAELSVRARCTEDVDAALQGLEIDVLATPRAALFMAGKVFARYREGGGARSGVLPDFFIGAHAAVGNPSHPQTRHRHKSSCVEGPSVAREKWTYWGCGRVRSYPACLVRSA